MNQVMAVAIQTAIPIMVGVITKKYFTLKILMKVMAASSKVPKEQILLTPPTIQIEKLGNSQVMMLDHQQII